MTVIGSAIDPKIAEICGAAPRSAQQLSGGCVGDVARVDLSDGRTVVVKLGDGSAGLAVEAFMLRYLAANTSLPVPEVYLGNDDLIVMAYLKSDGRMNHWAKVHAADLVAALHENTADKFGFECTTVIGGLAQPNPWQESWADFFRDHRLLDMGRRAMDTGKLPTAVYGRLERLSGKLHEWIEEPASPALIHGDMWGGNVLVNEGLISGFIDPAVYYADPEIELAFTTLFNTFGDRFFARYREHRPIRPGFFEARVDLYNLYPLLVHVHLFGGSYVGSVDRTLERFGC